MDEWTKGIEVSIGPVTVSVKSGSSKEDLESIKKIVESTVKFLLEEAETHKKLFGINQEEVFSGDTV